MSGCMGSVRKSSTKRFRKKKKRQLYLEKAKNRARNKGEEASTIVTWGEIRGDRQYKALLKKSKKR